jgi:hypothetical protein
MRGNTILKTTKQGMWENHLSQELPTDGNVAYFPWGELLESSLGHVEGVFTYTTTAVICDNRFDGISVIVVSNPHSFPTEARGSARITIQFLIFDESELQASDGIDRP